ncbi:glycosyl hydrolase YngK-like [Globicephala melas]|uniref:glycosyl hydrolase YngK-like n=1 Tax=Globicephala melas TaxID=9731 RepID=UPI00293D5D7A|nr:glycosyl hydrolase YngK-like [Globicephala melas]
MFQVRPEFDACYQSNIEPWSRYLSGEQGVAPKDSFDPLACLIELCHKNGMELHAWLNPYRAAANKSKELAPSHLAKLKPKWFVTYNNQLILNPAIPQAREYVCRVVKDIVMRYDVDAIHFDDYFYPYPKEGEVFEDDLAFEEYGLPMGYKYGEKDKFRRNNINLLISSIANLLKDTKPWVRFGISPFGIYRNELSDPRRGSRTLGLQCYDDLYADVLHWAEEGWIDYVVPQIYWNSDNVITNYDELVEWWSKQLRGTKAQFYVGQHIRRTIDGNELMHKMLLSQEYSKGNVFWPAEDLFQNYGAVSDSIARKYQDQFALLPEYEGALGKSQAPRKIDMLWEDYNEDGHMLIWRDLADRRDPEKAFMYIVYAFPKGIKPSCDKSKYIISISSEASLLLPKLEANSEYTIYVTSVNRFWQESEPAELKLVFK